MEPHEHANGAPTPTDKKPVEPARPRREEPAPAERTWGKGAATALERLRRNGYRRGSNPDRPKSE